MKGPDIRKQQFYPTPPTSVKPDFWDRPPSLSVSEKTAEAQQEIVDIISRDSEYTRQYSASGSTQNRPSLGTQRRQTQGSQVKVIIKSYLV